MMLAGKLRLGLYLVVLALLSGSALAGPGDPLVNGGCVPLGARQYSCEVRIAARLLKSWRAIAKCHQIQARAAFLNQGSFDEEACEAEALAPLRRLPADCDPEVVRAAEPMESDLTSFLDVNVNGALYCDGSSAIPIDITGDDAGFVPATRDALVCMQRLGKELGEFPRQIVECLRKAVNAARRDKPFDGAACRSQTRSAYDRAAFKALQRRGACPFCLQATQRSMADDSLSFLDAHWENLFVCLSGYFFQRQGFALDHTAPTAATFERAAARRLSQDEAGVFPTFMTAPFPADTVLDPSGLVALHLAASHDMEACADVQVVVERVAGDGTRTTLGTALKTNVTLSQVTTKPSLPLGLELVLDERSVPADHRLAATVVVTNRCRGNRGVVLDYEGRDVPSRIIVNPAHVDDPTPTPTPSPFEECPGFPLCACGSDVVAVGCGFGFCPGGGRCVSDGDTCACVAPSPSTPTPTVTPTGQVCGGIAGVPCPEGAFCEFPTGACGCCDREGLCVEAPRECNCGAVFEPVCGCSGTTHANDCERRCAGDSVLYPGPCDPTPTPSPTPTPNPCPSAHCLNCGDLCLCAGAKPPNCLGFCATGACINLNGVCGCGQ